MKSLIRGTLGGLALMALACSDGPTGIPPGIVETVEVLPVAKTLSVGDTMRLTANPKTAAGEVLGGLPTRWESEDDAIAGVSALGRVTAKKPGTARVTATVGGKVGSTDVAVVAVPLVVDRVEIPSLPSELEVGRQVHIEAILRAEDGTAIGGRAVTWKSSHGQVATVDSYMNSPFAHVTAHSPGQATITAEAAGRSVSVAVRVRPK